jgi:outer membrane murein-binding lipoprotein Lpp
MMGAMNSRRAVIILASLAAACTLAGCRSHSTTSKAEFISKADAICAKGADDTDAISTDASLPEVMHQSREIFSGAVHDLKTLDRPAEGAAQIDEWLRVLDQELVLFGRFEKAADGHDLAKLDALSTQEQRLEGSSQRLARRFGFDACAH